MSALWVHISYLLTFSCMNDHVSSHFCVWNVPAQLHGRSREQRYTRLADWRYINQCSSLAEQLPVFGESVISVFSQALYWLRNELLLHVCKNRVAVPFLKLRPLSTCILNFISSGFVFSWCLLLYSLTLILCRNLSSAVGIIRGCRRLTLVCSWNTSALCLYTLCMCAPGNGDVMSYNDYAEHRQNTGVAGCMIARYVCTISSCCRCIHWIRSLVHSPLIGHST